MYCLHVLIIVHVATFPKNNIMFNIDPLAITSWSVQDISQLLLCIKVASEILGWYTSVLENLKKIFVIQPSLPSTYLPSPLPPPPPNLLG